MAKKIKAKNLIEDFQTMYVEHWPYEWGKAERGCVDCSGAFVYAYRKYGKTIAHGSNAIARGHIAGKLLPISQAQPGMVAFKLYVPGERGYDLPGKYKKGGAAYNGDLNDYHHVGLVGYNPDYVYNAKGTNYGFCRDKIQSGWDRVAYLKAVEYDNDEQEEEEEDMGEVKAVVALPTGASGSTVNLRASASKDAKVIAKVPVGTTVTVLKDDEFWCQIEAVGKTGWMMSNYLEYAGEDGSESSAPIPDDYREYIADALQRIDSAVSEIKSAVATLGDMITEG